MKHRFLDTAVPHGNVVFNFRGSAIDDLGAFAEGYRRAGKVLAEKLSTSECPDFEGYPILFLYRHALELYLKAIIYRGAKLLGLITDESVDTSKLLTRHDLLPLIPPIKEIFQRIGWTDDFELENIKNFKDFQELVRAVDKIDPRSLNFRYPVTRSGDEAVPHHFVINVLEFARQIDPVLLLLDGALTGLGEYYDTEAEQMYELQNYFLDYG